MDSEADSDIQTLVLPSPLPPVKYRAWPLEFSILALLFASELSSSVLTNQFIYQTCVVTLGYNETDCRKLGSNNETEHIRNLETQSQKYVTSIQMVRLLIESIIPSILSLFIGPWSDKYGRKPVVLASFYGYMGLYLTFAVVNFISNLMPVSPWFYLFGSVVMTLGGGMCSIITGMYAYIADTTTEKNRESRMLRIECAVSLGLFLGAISCSHIYNATNTFTVLIISLLLTTAGGLSIIIGIEESVKITEDNQQKSKFKELFKFDLVRDLFHASFKQRPNRQRAIIWIIMAMLIVNILSMDGSSTIFFLFLREKLGWTIATYSDFIAFTIVILFVGGLLSAFVLVPLGLTGPFLILVGNVSSCINAVLVALATESWHLFAIQGLSLLRMVTSPMMRALLSNSVEAVDVGKLMSLTTTFESLSSIIAAPLYTFVYNQTLDTYPGAFNFISAGIFGFCIVGTLIVICLRRRNPNVQYVNLNS